MQKYSVIINDVKHIFKTADERQEFIEKTVFDFWTKHDNEQSKAPMSISDLPTSPEQQYIADLMQKAGRQYTEAMVKTRGTGYLDGFPAVTAGEMRKLSTDQLRIPTLNDSIKVNLEEQDHSSNTPAPKITYSDPPSSAFVSRLADLKFSLLVLITVAEELKINESTLADLRCSYSKLLKAAIAITKVS